MPSNRAFPRLLAEVARQQNSAQALNCVVRSASQMTGSRYAVLTVVNEDLGSIEIRSVQTGEGWLERAGVPELSVDSGLVGFVIATGASLHVGSADREEYYKRLLPDTKSEIAVPVKDRNGRVRGALAVESDTFDAYGKDEQEAIEALGYLVAMLLAQDEQSKREEALLQIGHAVDAIGTEESLIDGVIQIAENILRLQACSIFLLDSKTETYVLRGTVGNLRDRVGKVGYLPGEGCTGWVCQTGQPIMLEDPQQDSRWRGKFVEFPHEEVAGFLAVPIISRNRSIGAIRVVRRKSDNRFVDNRFTPDDMRLLKAIADQVAVGLENIRALELMMRSERMIAWGELSAKSSHMIGNRIFALRGDINELAHLLRESPNKLDALAALQSSLSTNVTRIEEVLHDFRDFITATQVERAPTDLNALISGTVTEMFPKRSGVKLEFDLDSELPEVPLDPKRFRRAISELVENALNHMETGSLCVCTKSVTGDERGRIVHGRSKRYARIEIEDTGPGIEADQKNLIFQPFFSKRVRGMGLGLSIVKGIVDAHGGEVFEEGEEGSGAKFVILLPIGE